MTDLTREYVQKILDGIENTDAWGRIVVEKLSRQLLATMTALAEAQAAQAATVDECAHIAAGFDGFGMVPGFWPSEIARRIRSLADPTGVKLLAELRARAEKAEQERDTFRINLRSTFEAMCAMRDAINEYVPMPSLESDLLQGPENSIFCATVAEAVITRLAAETARADAAEALVNGLRVGLLSVCEYEPDERDNPLVVIMRMAGLARTALAQQPPASGDDGRG